MPVGTSPPPPPVCLDPYRHCPDCWRHWVWMYAQGPMLPRIHRMPAGTSPPPRPACLDRETSSQIQENRQDQRWMSSRLSVSTLLGRSLANPWIGPVDPLLPSSKLSRILWRLERGPQQLRLHLNPQDYSIRRHQGDYGSHEVFQHGLNRNLYCDHQSRLEEQTTPYLPSATQRQIGGLSGSLPRHRVGMMPFHRGLPASHTCQSEQGAEIWWTCLGGSPACVVWIVGVTGTPNCSYFHKPSSAGGAAPHDTANRAL